MGMRLPPTEVAKSTTKNLPLTMLLYSSGFSSRAILALNWAVRPGLRGASAFWLFRKLAITVLSWLMATLIAVCSSEVNAWLAGGAAVTFMGGRTVDVVVVAGMVVVADRVILVVVVGGADVVAVMAVVAVVVLVIVVTGGVVLTVVGGGAGVVVTMLVVVIGTVVTA
jgi:hypothetical protein